MNKTLDFILSNLYSIIFIVFFSIMFLVHIYSAQHIMNTNGNTNKMIYDCTWSMLYMIMILYFIKMK
jgi:hypothetical protein